MGSDTVGKRLNNLEKKVDDLFSVCVSSRDITLDSHPWVTWSTHDFWFVASYISYFKAGRKIGYSWFIVAEGANTCLLTLSTSPTRKRKENNMQQPFCPVLKQPAAMYRTEKYLYLGFYYKLPLVYKWSLLYHETYWGSLKLKLISQSLKFQRRDRKLQSYLLWLLVISNEKCLIFTWQ